MPEYPQQVGPYEIVAPIGAGGMGQVYKARDPRLNRDVAVKILPPEFNADRSRRLRFEQEARAIAALNHPGIVSVYDVGDGWMVTELVDGETLRKQELSRRQIIDIGAQVADALAAAHEAGITHRDLKPENILLTRDGRTKILDFGLAKVSPDAASAGRAGENSTVTNPGVATGTPGYMAPEQVRGQATDHRADMFSLGVVLYELLAGHPAFQAESAVEVMHAIVHEDPPELPPEVPDGLRRIVKRCLEKNPAKRFQSARDLAFALRALSGSAGSHPALEIPESVEPRRSPNWMPWALGGAVLALLLTLPFLLRDAESPRGVDLSNYQFLPFAFSKAQEHSAVWSPDGQTVAYIEESGPTARLMIQAVDAPTPSRLASDVSPSPGQLAWSAEGTRIYFLRGGRGGGVYEVSTAGGNPSPVLLGTAPGGNTNGAGGLGFGTGPGGAGPGRAGRGAFGKGKTEDAVAPTATTNATPANPAAPSTAAANVAATNGANAQGTGTAPASNGPPKSAPKGKGGTLAGFATGSITAFDISRDGKHLAVWQSVPVEGGLGASRSSVWIASPPNSEPVQYTPDEAFAVLTPFTPVYLRFAPDASTIFLSYYGDEGAETWLLPFDPETGNSGGAPRRIFEEVHWNGTVPASWMPDSRHIVLAGNAVPITGQQLWMADVESQSLTAIMAWPEGGQTTPSVSPDGKRLLFSHVARDRDLVELPLNGDPPVTLLGTTLPEFGVDWSPRGDQYVYVTRRNGQPEIWVRSPEGMWDRPVVTSREFPNLETLISPTFSPDGTRIAYTALLAGSRDRCSLAVSPATGGTPTVIGKGYSVSWFPRGEGSYIAFLWLKDDGTLPIAVHAIGSDSEPNEIMVAGGIGAPEWSPNGQWLAAPRSGAIELVPFGPLGSTAVLASTPNIVTLPVPPLREPGESQNGGSDVPERFTPRLLRLPHYSITGLNAQAIAWARDSQTMYGLSYLSDPAVLSSVDITTGQVTKIAEYPGLSFQPVLENTYTGSIRLSLSPDGASLATATATNQADLWILDGFAQ